jgi:Ca2+-binding RTX toxin-like protein
VYSPASKTLAVTATAKLDDARVSRDAGGTLRVDGQTCGGATVTNTDTINYVDFSGGDTTLELDLANGPLGPGATTEAGGASEIEVVADVDDGGTDTVAIAGAPAVDAGSDAKGQPGLNLNPTEPARDVDVTGPGIDRITYASPAAGGGFRASDREGFAGPLAIPTRLTGAGGVDTFLGGTKTDVMIGGGGDDKLAGRAGTDTILPGQDDDSVDGGDGEDLVSYADVPSGGVSVDLRNDDIQPTGAGGDDELNVVERLHGTSFNDDLRGDGAANEIDGRGGDDVIAGHGGPDKLNGGVGDHDAVSYAAAPSGVTVSIKGGGSADGGDGKDSLNAFENIVGSEHDDVLTANDMANAIDARGGTDKVTAAAGPDTLVLRDGRADAADCGDGADIVMADAAVLDALTACEAVDAAPAPPPSPAGGDQGPPAAPAPGAPAADAPAPVAPSAAPPAAQRPAPLATLGLKLRAAKRLRGGKLRATLRCDAACTVRLRAVVRIGGRKVVVKRTNALAAGKRTTVALRLPRGAKRVAITASATAPGRTPARAVRRVRIG